MTMNINSKNKIRDIIANDLLSIHNRRVELSKRLAENSEESLDYLRSLFEQLSQSTSGLIVAKTPKLLRKRAVQYIETIPENEVLKQERTSIESFRSVNSVVDAETSEVSTRVKRTASKKAADNIKKQYSFTADKQKKPFNDSDNDSDNGPVKEDNQKRQIKRKKHVTISSDEDDSRSDPKYSKLDVDLSETKPIKKATKKKSQQIVRSVEKVLEKSSPEDVFKSLRLLRSSSDKSILKTPQAAEEEQEKDNTIVVSNIDNLDVEELSMYEDAISKPMPLMNSTLKYSSVNCEKIPNAVVVLEELPLYKNLNETVVIQKASARNSRESRKRNSKTLQDSRHTYKQVMQDDDCNGLITDDESPVEKKSKRQPEKKQNTKKQTKRAKSQSSDDDPIPSTPVMERFRDAVAPATVQENKPVYKSNALFSPYAKESVKKRVEAFEQAVMHNPNSVDMDAPMRITRTKTRAMTAAENETETKNADKNVTQILARKSVAKAKKISLAKQKKDNEEFKENKESMPERINKLFLNDKSNAATKQQQQQQQKTTPLSKSRTVQPLSNRLHTPLNTQNLANNGKALTASRTNIVTNIESFIQPPKSVTKTNSVEKLEEKKRQEDDARRKREEALRLLTEEKRRKRQEKELKNKLAREAKEKQELQKRQKAEREREEKAKLALLMQEKQREEMERKRLAQLQRAQEKEERRKLEEQQRLRKLQEQEEAERVLAEQRRREQEAEKRKEVEARAQQQAAAEALRQKNQMLAKEAQAKYKQQINKKHQGATNYILDSEPDDDESDDESRPKHEIPYWAQSHVRKVQLTLQQYIPQEIVYKFFDSRKCTPDLTEIFHGIDKSRLKRTSSAIWRAPPRISLMETE